MAGHHHAMKEVQEIGISLTQQFEKMRVTVINPDSGKFILNFQDPVSLAYNSSKEITANGDASHFASQIHSYCRSVINNYCDVELESQVDRNIYTITLRKLRVGASTTNVLVAKTSTTATVNVELPDQVQLSSAPLRGKYRVKCTDKDGYVRYSEEIKWSDSENWVNQHIMNNCTDFYDKIETEWTNTNRYYDNGVAYRILFNSYNADPGQFEIVSSESDPLTGDGITFTSSTIQPYSTNLFYKPVPFEFWKTYETKPQMIVSVNDQPAVCHNLTCDYTYSTPTGAVDSFTFAASSNLLTISGTNLPATLADIQAIHFAKA
jgi:hypothetical protein